MIKRIVVLVFLISWGKWASADVIAAMEGEVNFQMSQQLLDNDSTKKPVKFKRGKVILFTIFTGILGGHRIYLGTHQRVPILYSVTLGGLGILPLIDLVHVIFTKDLSRYEDKSQIIMWKK